jgi:hypothetical protein
MYLQGPLDLYMDKSLTRLEIAAWERDSYLGEAAQKDGIHWRCWSKDRSFTFSL